MPLWDQLEIIRSNGEVEFYTLDPRKGIANIGRHPENDIVLVSAGVAPFHAVLDHRQKPFHLVVLSQEGITTLNGQIVSPNVATPIEDRAIIRINGHVIVFIEGAQPAAGATAGVGLPAVPAHIPAPGNRPEPIGLEGDFPEYFNSIPQDITSDAIILEMAANREQTVDVDQTASYQLTIINGGNIVATFAAHVVGIDPDWVEVSPPQVNLFEGERTSVTVNIMPPRHPDSSAGSHPFALIVTSPNYPRQQSQRGAVLNVEPFYDFTVGELAPKRQTISWFKHSGQTYVSITNTGNSDALFRVDGEDDERACSFEFTIPGQSVGLAKQADLTVPSNETISIPVSITPYSRRLVSLRKRAYNFTITTTLLGEQQQTPRSLLGDLKSAPLIGPVLIVLILLFILGIIFYTFWPNIIRFDVRPNAIAAGQDVEVFWNTFPPFFIDVRLDGEPVDASGSLVQEELQKSKTFVLTADTWLSKIFRVLSDRQERPVIITPVRPEISLFEVQPEEITSGDSVVLSWFVVGADSITLINNSAGTTNEINEPAGSVLLLPKEDTTFTLQASSISAPEDPVQRLVNIRVTTPTPEPLPAPVINQFLVEPKVITPGQSVLLQWSVSGAESVDLQPIGSGLPAVSPPITHNPQQTTLYVLSASNGQESVNAVQQVVVGQVPTPTPTATPGAAPQIDLLAVTPLEVVRVDTDDRGSEDNEIEAQVNWVVTGATTNVELTGGPPGFEKLSNLPRMGDVLLKVRDTTVFVLTAYNGDTSVVKTTQIQFLDPTPTPEPTPTTAATSGSGGSGGGGSSTPTPAPVIVSFAAAGVSPPTDQVTQVGSDYQVVAGSNVILTWSTQYADTVTLVGVGDQPPAGSYTVNNVVVNQIFQLTAQNSSGNTQSFINLVVVAKPVPPAPTNVAGSESGANVTLTWDYANENDIIGFRVYRAVTAGGPFTRIADETQLANSARQYVDSGVLPGCVVYYMTAVYTDPQSGNKFETQASSNSWFSSGCP